METIEYAVDAEVKRSTMFLLSTLLHTCGDTYQGLIQDFSLGGEGANISVRQHFGTRHWDLYCVFWSISCACVLVL